MPKSTEEPLTEPKDFGIIEARFTIEMQDDFLVIADRHTEQRQIVLRVDGDLVAVWSKRLKAEIAIPRQTFINMLLS